MVSAVPPTSAPWVPENVTPVPAVMEEVATLCSAPVPAPYKRFEEVKEVLPVPPFATATVPVTLEAVPPMLRVEVLIAVMFPVVPVGLPRRVLAPAWARSPTVTLLAPMVVVIAVVPVPETSPERVMLWLPVRYVLVSSVKVLAPVIFTNAVEAYERPESDWRLLERLRVPLAPPTSEPRVPEYVRPVPRVRVVVATEVRPFVPFPYRS